MIQKTKEYSLFQFLKGNRNVRANHVRRLVESISKHNMLSKNPIIVDSNMNVIDGQHRLAAAQSLGKAIYYVQADEYNFGDVLLLNTSSKQWDVEDFLHAYITMGKEDYITLATFAKKYELPISISVMLLQGSKNTLRRAAFRRFTEGDFKVEDLDGASYIAETLLATREFCEGSIWKTRDYVLAMARLMQDFDKEQILKKVSNFGKKLERARNYKDYLRQFEDVINKFKRGADYRLF